MLPNLQTKSNDRMLVTRIQPGPFSGYDSATRGTIVGSNGIKKMPACAVEAGSQNLFYPSHTFHGTFRKLFVDSHKYLRAQVFHVPLPLLTS